MGGGQAGVRKRQPVDLQRAAVRRRVRVLRGEAPPRRPRRRARRAETGRGRRWPLLLGAGRGSPGAAAGRPQCLAHRRRALARPPPAPAAADLAGQGDAQAHDDHQRVRAAGGAGGARRRRLGDRHRDSAPQPQPGASGGWRECPAHAARPGTGSDDPRRDRGPGRARGHATAAVLRAAARRGRRPRGRPRIPVLRREPWRGQRGVQAAHDGRGEGRGERGERPHPPVRADTDALSPFPLVLQPCHEGALGT